MRVWLVGCGAMAVDYHKVLVALGVEVTVVGRGPASAQRFTAATGAPVVTGGCERALNAARPLPDAVIVSVGVDALAAASTLLIEAGVRRLLVEKPGALSTAEIEGLQRTSRAADAEVVIGYNRRFFSAVRHAQRMIADDGGVLSCHFDFTEWSHEIEALARSAEVKNRWFLANSTHVADLAFHLAGAPRELHAFCAGSLSWHPVAAAFAGAGVTDREVPFSYHANWSGPGRWSVEAVTRNHRFIFRPMETLQVMRSRSVQVTAVEIEDAVDRRSKPGLFEQTRRFMEGESGGFCTLDEQAAHWPYYCRIAGYTPPGEGERG